MITTRCGNETKNAHKCIKVCFNLNTVCVLHVSATLMVIPRMVHFLSVCPHTSLQELVENFSKINPFMLTKILDL